MSVIGLYAERPALVAQLDARSTGGQEISVHLPQGQQYSFVKINHEIFSSVILSLPLIQEGQFSVSGDRICTILVGPVKL